MVLLMCQRVHQLVLGKGANFQTNLSFNLESQTEAKARGVICVCGNLVIGAMYVEEEQQRQA